MNSEKPSFGRARDLIKQARDQTRANQERERRALDKDKNPWMYYAKDVGDWYIRSFGTAFPEAMKELPNRLKERRERGEQVLVVDVCGIANAKSLGADKTICFTLDKPRNLRESESFSVVEGDIFSPRSQKMLLSAIDSTHIPVSCIFFHPVAGLSGYEENEYTHAKLYALLKELYARLAENGEIYAQASDFGVGAKILLNSLNGRVEEPFCFSLPLDTEARKYASVLHIVKSPKALAALPDLQDIH